MTSTQKDTKTYKLTGIVQKHFISTVNANTGQPRPYRLIVESDGEEFDLSDFPNNDGTIPSAFAGLDLDNIEGQKVIAIATWKSEYKGMQQYKPIHIEVVGAAPPVATEPATQANPPATPPGGMTRTEYGMAKGNAISASTALLAAYISNVGELPPVEFLEEGARLINTTSEAILSGRMVEPDAEEPAPEPASDDDDADTTGESFGAIQLGDKS